MTLLPEVVRPARCHLHVRRSRATSDRYGSLRPLVYCVAILTHAAEWRLNMKRAILVLKGTILIAGAMAASFAIAAPPEKTFHLGIVHGQVSAQERVMRVEQGDRVHVRAMSDAAGELHLHGYRLAATLEPGAVADITFEAYATGRYSFEWHPAGDGPPRAHHGPPLAALEVRPE
jgi:hypothetical protein